MPTKADTFLKQFSKPTLPDVRPGDTVRVLQKIKEDGAAKSGETRERTQAFEGIVIARKHGKEMGATITVRKVVGGIGVERIYPLHSPTIEAIEILQRGKARRAKLYYLRGAKGKRAKVKTKQTPQSHPMDESQATPESSE